MHTNLIKKLEDSDENILRNVITEWMKGHDDFRKHVEDKLFPAAEDIDFGYELSRKTDRETKNFYHRNTYAREATDWSNVYYDLIKPWGDQAERFPTAKLYELVKEIITKVGMTITEEDFYGDDWYGDDFSRSIGDIMETLGNIAGLLLVREDISEEMLSGIETLVKKAQKTDVIDSYIVCVPYCNILEMIKIRHEADEATSGMFDIMIDADYQSQGGKWLCRQIDFIRSMGMTQEAQVIMDDNLDFPDVCLKKYGELMAEENWEAALQLLNEAQKNKENWTMRYSIVSPNWLEMKQALIAEHGSHEEQIENLCHLFYDSYGDEAKERYYTQLKSMIPPDEWMNFYRKLLLGVPGYDTLDTIAPFLIKERELSWLHRLVSESEKRDASDYRTPLKYALALSPEFHNETAAQLIRTFRAYSADRFPPKKQVKSGKYSYFRADLEKLLVAGYGLELKELVEYFLTEYHFRPSFVKELKAIALP